MDDERMDVGVMKGWRMNGWKEGRKERVLDSQESSSHSAFFFLVCDPSKGWCEV